MENIKVNNMWYEYHIMSDLYWVMIEIVFLSMCSSKYFIATLLDTHL